MIWDRKNSTPSSRYTLPAAVEIHIKRGVKRGGVEILLLSAVLLQYVLNFHVHVSFLISFSFRAFTLGLLLSFVSFNQDNPPNSTSTYKTLTNNLLLTETRKSRVKLCIYCRRWATK